MSKEFLFIYAVISCNFNSGNPSTFQLVTTSRVLVTLPAKYVDDYVFKLGAVGAQAPAILILFGIITLSCAIVLRIWAFYGNTLFSYVILAVALRRISYLEKNSEILQRKAS